MVFLKYSLSNKYIFKIKKGRIFLKHKQMCILLISYHQNLKCPNNCFLIMIIKYFLRFKIHFHFISSRLMSKMVKKIPISVSLFVN